MLKIGPEQQRTLAEPLAESFDSTRFPTLSATSPSWSWASTP